MFWRRVQRGSHVSPPESASVTRDANLVMPRTAFSISPAPTRRKTGWAGVHLERLLRVGVDVLAEGPEGQPRLAAGIGQRYQRCELGDAEDGFFDFAGPHAQENRVAEAGVYAVERAAADGGEAVMQRARIVAGRFQQDIGDAHT